MYMRVLCMYGRVYTRLFSAHSAARVASLTPAPTAPPKPVTQKVIKKPAMVPKVIN